jgi:hypothetical protein
MHDAGNGSIEISESEWPCYLYPGGTISDVDDDLTGLFRGYLLPRVCRTTILVWSLISVLQVFRQIYTGPRSALDPGATKKGRLSKAHLHNLTEVLPRNIAYTCVIVSCIFSLISFDVDLNYRPALPCAAWVGPSTTVLSSTASSIKI